MDKGKFEKTFESLAKSAGMSSSDINKLKAKGKKVAKSIQVNSEKVGITKERVDVVKMEGKKASSAVLSGVSAVSNSKIAKSIKEKATNAVKNSEMYKEHEMIESLKEKFDEVYAFLAEDNAIFLKEMYVGMKNKSTEKIEYYTKGKTILWNHFMSIEDIDGKEIGGITFTPRMLSTILEFNRSIFGEKPDLDLKKSIICNITAGQSSMELVCSKERDSDRLEYELRGSNYKMEKVGIGSYIIYHNKLAVGLINFKLSFNGLDLYVSSNNKEIKEKCIIIAMAYELLEDKANEVW